MTFCEPGIPMRMCGQARTNRVRHAPICGAETEFPKGVMGRASGDLADIVRSRRCAMDARPDDRVPGRMAGERFDLLHVCHRTDDRVRRPRARAYQYALDHAGDRPHRDTAHRTGRRCWSACIARSHEAPGQLRSRSIRPACWRQTGVVAPPRVICLGRCLESFRRVLQLAEDRALVHVHW